MNILKKSSTSSIMDLSRNCKHMKFPNLEMNELSRSPLHFVLLSVINPSWKSTRHGILLFLNESSWESEVILCKKNIHMSGCLYLCHIDITLSNSFSQLTFILIHGKRGYLFLALSGSLSTSSLVLHSKQIKKGKPVH